MKNNIKILATIFIVLIMGYGCKDEESIKPTCINYPNLTVDGNLVGTWIINDDEDLTVEFYSDRLGRSSVRTPYFYKVHDDDYYRRFGWTMENDTTILFKYDFGSFVPPADSADRVETFIVTSNLCDYVIMENEQGTEVQLTR